VIENLVGLGMVAVVVKIVFGKVAPVVEKTALVEMVAVEN